MWQEKKAWVILGVALLLFVAVALVFGSGDEDARRAEDLAPAGRTIPVGEEGAALVEEKKKASVDEITAGIEAAAAEDGDFEEEAASELEAAESGNTIMGEWEQSYDESAY